MPGDTIRLPPGDTALVPIPLDLEPTDTVPETLREAAEQSLPTPVMPDFPTAAPPGWSAPRWTWTRPEIAMIPGITLLDLIERLPGFVTFRAGDFGRPAGLTSAGIGGGRLRVWVDGYELDPYDAAGYPLESIPLVDLNKVTVERTISEIRVEVESFRLESSEPYSEVQLGTGPFQSRLLRGLVSRGIGSRSVGTGAFDLVQTGGIGLDEAYAARNINFRWATIPSAKSGVQVEFRSTAIDREGEFFPLETQRTDLAVRGRRIIGERVTVEGIFGQTTVEGAHSYLAPDANPDGAVIAFEAPDRSELQAVGRGAYASERLTVTGTVRSRFGGTMVLPNTPLEIDGGFSLRPSPWLRVEGGATVESSDFGSAQAFRFMGAVTPHPVITLFGSAEAGTRLRRVRFLPISTILPPVDPEGPATVDTARLVFQPGISDAAGFRAGVELAGNLGSAGVALVDAATTQVSGFGLPWDIRMGSREAEPYRGVETYFDIPLVPGIPAIRLDGWYIRSLGEANRRYAPTDMGRFGLTIHDQFIGGQLEPYLRLELLRQGPTIMPLGALPGTDQVLPVIQTMNLEFRLRIIDVQAFLIWNNLLLADLSVPIADAPVPRPRVIYGASWRFRN